MGLHSLDILNYEKRGKKPTNQAGWAVVGYFGDRETPFEQMEGWRFSIVSKGVRRDVYADGSSVYLLLDRIGACHVSDADETRKALAELGVIVKPVEEK